MGCGKVVFAGRSAGFVLIRRHVVHDRSNLVYSGNGCRWNGSSIVSCLRGRAEMLPVRADLEACGAGYAEPTGPMLDT